MSKKRERGKVVHKEYIQRKKFSNNTEYERTIWTRINELKMMYSKEVCCIIEVFRNPSGARIIAYRLKKEESI